MSRRRLAVAFIYVFVLNASHAPVSRSETPNERSDALTKQLMSPNARERLRAFDELIRARRDAVESLVAVASSAGEREHEVSARAQAIRTLGELRAEEGIGVLSHQLTCWFPAHLWRRHPLDHYLAAWALLQIGPPAVPTVLSRLNADVASEEMSVIAWWFHSLDGRDLGLARLKLALEGGNGLSEKGKANLARLIKVYQSIDFSDPVQWPRPRTRSDHAPANVERAKEPVKEAK